MPKRATLKQAGKCIFCLGGAVPGNPMTGEHLWSNWMDDLLPRVAREYMEIASNVRRYTKAESTFQRYREGAPFNKTIKAVCKRCNSGWMNEIETAVRPIITPLIKGHRTTLTSAMRRTLLEWIVLKLFVAEHSRYRNYDPDPIFTQAERDDFRLRRGIPDGIRVYLLRQTGTKWSAGYHRHASGLGFIGPQLPPPKYPTAIKNVQAVVWGMGKLLIYISVVTVPEIRKVFRFGKTPPFRRLWPLASNDLSWPPPYSVNDAFVDDLAGALQRYLDANMMR